MSVWDKLAKKYDGIWLQKYSLTPTRNKVLEIILAQNKDNFKLLDIGCATGQTLNSIMQLFDNVKLTGIDKSEKMLEIARKKNKKIKYLNKNIEDFNINEKFDFIICTHSFPYYNNKIEVVKKVSDLLENDGKAVFIQASINSFYDKFCMFIIELTAEKADYLSVGKFTKLVENDFLVEGVFKIKEIWYAPSIYGFILRKKNENFTN